MKQFRRFFCLFLSAALVAGILTGCGNKKSDDADDASATNASSETLTIQDDDTMHLNMLFSLISTPDNGVTELLGDGNHQKYNADGTLSQREYDGIVYGQKVSFTVSYNEYNDVDSIYVTFGKPVTKEQIIHAMTELLGREPNDSGAWTTDTATVSITQSDTNICITLKQYEAEASADSHQY